MKEALFFIVIFLANIIQGITGFAGTILAMPFSIMLVGGDVARPVLNVLGILSGIYVFAGNREKVNKEELKKILSIMAVGIFIGMFIRRGLSGQEKILYTILGVFVMVLAVNGLWKLFGKAKENRSTYGNLALLAGAGVIHGMFVSGGPLLIGYLTKKISDKEAFRATISTVWIVLNGIIFIADILGGCYEPRVIRAQLLAVPFLLAGMFVGAKLYKIMSQRTFMVITYVLLFVSGISLLLK